MRSSDGDLQDRLLRSVDGSEVQACSVCDGSGEVLNHVNYWGEAETDTCRACGGTGDRSDLLLFACRPEVRRAKSQSGPVAWFGGKGHIAGWVVDHLPPHDTYVEPYGGAGSVLFTKKPAPIEVWNDLHGDLTNLFTVIRSGGYERLQAEAASVLHSRPEYERAVDVLNGDERDPHARALAFFIAMNQGFGGTYPTLGRWAKSKGQRLSGGMGNNTAQWWRKVAFIDDWHERLASVQIENRDALDVIRDYDSPSTVFYLDPPYPGEKRPWSLNAYKHEVTDDHHEKLVDVALRVDGAVVLSGYDTGIYDPLRAAGWRAIERSVHARGAGNKGGKARVEVLWCSP